MNNWYNQSVDSKKFRTGLREAPESQLVKLLVAFTVKRKRGEKVTDEINAVREEKERRRKMDGSL